MACFFIESQKREGQKFVGCPARYNLQWLRHFSGERRERIENLDFVFQKKPSLM